MSLLPIRVTISREIPGGVDAFGNDTVSTEVVFRGSATKNFYSRTSQMQLEQGAHNTQGPGISTKTQQFFKFEARLRVDVQRGDTIEDGDGLKWVVQFVRSYDTTLQVDCEAVT